MCIRDRDNTVITWGRNENNQIDNLPNGLTNVEAIETGIACSMVLKKDGSIVIWGEAHFGQSSVPEDLLVMTYQDDCVQDCAGEWGGSAIIDECGVCNGDGIADGACDCDGNTLDCTGECGGDSVVDGCEVCGGDDSSCAAPTDLSATGLRGEVALSWTANEAASSYNIYRDGELVGTTSNTTYMDPDGAGFGLGYSTVYCYTVSTNSVDGVEGPLSETACAQTLPFVLAGLSVDIDPIEKLNEELVIAGSIIKTSNPSIYEVDSDISNQEQILSHINKMKSFLLLENKNEALSLFHSLSLN